MKSIYIEGGSSAYGMHDTQAGGWAARLHRDSLVANEAHPTQPIVVVNRALPGIVLSVINKKFAEELYAPHKPTPDRQVRILGVGVNESKILAGWSQPIVNLQRFTGEVATFARMSYENGMSTIYVGPQPIDPIRSAATAEVLGTLIDLERLDACAEAMKAQADRDLMPYVDVQDIFSDYPLEDVLANDGRHPNSFGHDLIYQHIRPFVGGLLSA